MFIVPATIAAHYTDEYIKSLKESKIFGHTPHLYILLQTLFILITLYLFSIFITKYKRDFQTTMLGSIFIALYFGIQVNYISMINSYID